MKAWTCKNPEAAQDAASAVAALSFDELPTPSPQAGQVLVAIEAAALNFPDVLIIQNKYQFKPAPPFVPGAESAGTVVALGEGVTRFAVGQRVGVLQLTGAFATHICAPQDAVVPLPTGFSSVDAAAFVMAYGTSYHALVDRAALQSGETVLILGAAGGVGSAAIQIAKKLGAKIIAAASTEAKCQACIALGADVAINYTNADLREAVKQHTGGKGADVVYDAVGGEWAEPAFRSIAWRGRYLVVGFAAGNIPALPFNLMLLKGASVVGVFWGDFARREPAANAKGLQTLAAWYQDGSIKPHIDAVIPMAELPRAYERIMQRQVVGKVVVVN